MKSKILIRKFHRWGAIFTALPVVIVIISGLLLQVKKEFIWIQPPSLNGETAELSLNFNQILDVAKKIPQANISNWNDINRLDIRPAKGMVKVRAKNSWEIQIDTGNGKVLGIAKRRSDIIESIHDGSFFHESFKLWVFFPSAVVLAGIWATGIYLFLLPYLIKRNRKRK